MGSGGHFDQYINLQDQLINKDIPALQKILPVKFKAVALKGRSNYVCPHRVQLFRAKENLSPKELRLLAKLLVWLPSTTTGDREELFMPDYSEQALWSQVASDATRTPALALPKPASTLAPAAPLSSGPAISQPRLAAGRYCRR
jgi:Rad3-related DNA helicase